MFALGIRYLSGYVTASEPDDRDRVEWPPHPGRVFMALAAAHFQTASDPNERMALLWLESLEAPSLKASETFPRTLGTQFVPVNPRLEDERKARAKERKDGKKPPPALQSAPGIIRTRQPRTFACAWLEDDTVWLVWPNVEINDRHRRALEALSAKVARIGHSTSLVQMWLPEPHEVPEPYLVPDEDRAVVHLRVATLGTLEDLERRFNGDAVRVFGELRISVEDGSDVTAQRNARKRLKDEFSNRPPLQLRPELSAYQGYAPASRSTNRNVATAGFFNLEPLILTLSPEDSPYKHLDLLDVLVLTRHWRRAILTNADDLSERAGAILSGHDANRQPLESPHLAFMPLAFVGHRNADGRLLGVGLALPDELSREHRREALRAVGNVRRLTLGRLGVWQVESETRSRPPWNLRAEAWTAHPQGATHWSTVTPVVYDRHPKSDDQALYRQQVAAMIAQACARIGLPEPREVIVTPVSAHLGVPPSHAFPRLQRKDDSLRRHTHAILVFEEPICGPVLIGAGRYRGYGLCRPLEDPDRATGSG